jgi:hypothetical protein
MMTASPATGTAPPDQFAATFQLVDELDIHLLVAALADASESTDARKIANDLMLLPL